MSQCYFSVVLSENAHTKHTKGIKTTSNIPPHFPGYSVHFKYLFLSQIVQVAAVNVFSAYKSDPAICIRFALTKWL